tara:strand:- start:62 stop:583 length:522 start_codon:yes stop_codon:yes gene_type:complete
LKNFFLFICIFISINHLHANNIATFKFSVILENFDPYINFVEKLDNFKKKKFEDLKRQEESIINFKKEIEDSKILFSEKEYLQKVAEYNEKKDTFEKKVNKLNDYLQNNIKNNEKKVLIKVINIVKRLSAENNIDIVFSDDQYFLAAENIDLSKKILDALNLENITLDLTKYD